MLLARRLNTSLNGDRVIWLIVAILSLFSLLTVYSATESLAYRYRDGNTESYLIRHAFFLFVGWALMLFVHRIPYMKLMKFAPAALWASVGLLVLTLLMGKNINEARRLVEIPGLNITFQSSDIAKLFLVLYLAKVLSDGVAKQDSFQVVFVPFILPILLICGLIAPSNLSTALTLFATSLVLLFIGGIKWQYLLYTVLFGVGVFAFLLVLGDIYPDLVRSETWESRVRDFLGFGEESYQAQQAKMAIARGGWLGVGPGNSVHAALLPNSFSDFIYAVIFEEYGLVGGVAVLLLYVWLMVRTARLVVRSKKIVGSLLALGLMLLIVFQALANMAVAVNLIPVTGLIMPLVGMGGTSMMFTCIALGIILSISKATETEPA